MFQNIRRDKGSKKRYLSHHDKFSLERTLYSRRRGEKGRKNREIRSKTDKDRHQIEKKEKEEKKDKEADGHMDIP